MKGSQNMRIIKRDTEQDEDQWDENESRIVIQGNKSENNKKNNSSLFFRYDYDDLREKKLKMLNMNRNRTEQLKYSKNFEEELVNVTKEKPKIKKNGIDHEKNDKAELKNERRKFIKRIVSTMVN